MLPSDYPSAPPKGYFLTRIYHPNISKAGEICVNTLKKDWQSSLGIGHVLQVVRCLLINPFPESALNEEAGKDFMEDYEEYCKKAKMYTEVCAAAARSAPDLSPTATQSLRTHPRRRRTRLVTHTRALAFSLLQVHASKGKKGGGTAEGSSGDDAEGEPLEKKQKPVDASKAAEKRRAEKKKSLKRL